MQSCLFQTGSIALPASRFFCEHLHQNLFWACISRIHAQVPLVTSGKLTESLHQQIPRGIDVSVMGYPAFRARPVPHIQPQLIEDVPALRASLARGIPAIHRDEDLVAPLEAFASHAVDCLSGAGPDSAAAGADTSIGPGSVSGYRSSPRSRAWPGASVPDLPPPPGLDTRARAGISQLRRRSSRNT